jgi:hypothetical protein
MIKTTILKKFAIPLVCLTMLVGLSAPAWAGTSFYLQTENEDNTKTNPLSNQNDTIATAQSKDYNLNTPSAIYYMNGTIKDRNDIDFYKFVYQKSAGSTASNGRFAITLEVSQRSNDYDLTLVDASNRTILTAQSYKQAAFQQNKIIRVPANTLTNNTTYYVKIVPKTIGSPTSTDYTLKFIDNISTDTITPGTGVIHLVSYDGKLSAPAVANARRETLDPNAKVLSASLTATKSPYSTGINWQMCVTPGAKYQQKWYNANWNTGDVPEIKTAGFLLKDDWYIAFSGTSIKAGINLVQVDNPKLTLTYEYDTTFAF